MPLASLAVLDGVEPHHQPSLLASPGVVSTKRGPSRSLRRRSPAMEISKPISQEELACMAIKLRNDLFDYEDKLGSCRDFAELKNSAGALVAAILEPVEFRLSAEPPKKLAQIYKFLRRRGSIPHALH